MGISEAIYIPAGLSLIADYHQGRSRSLAIGIHITGIYLGQAMGGFGATIALNLSWQTTFQIFGLVGVIYSVVLILFLREHKPDFSQQRKSPEISFSFTNLLTGYKVLLGSTAFWIMLFYFSAPSLPGWATKNWLPTLFQILLILICRRQVRLQL